MSQDPDPLPRTASSLARSLTATNAGSGPLSSCAARAKDTGGVNVLRYTCNAVGSSTCVRGRDFPLTHVDDPTALQVYLNTLTPPVSFARAAQLLNGPEPAFVAVNDLAKLEAVRGSGSGSWDILLPHGPSASDSPTCVVGNRTKLTQTNSIAFCFGGLYIRAYGAKLLAATQREF